MPQPTSSACMQQRYTHTAWPNTPQNSLTKSTCMHRMPRSSLHDVVQQQPSPWQVEDSKVQTTLRAWSQAKSFSMACPLLEQPVSRLLGTPGHQGRLEAGPLTSPHWLLVSRMMPTQAAADREVLVAWGSELRVRQQKLMLVAGGINCGCQVHIACSIGGVLYAGTGSERCHEL
jgi:hypothetical protein